MGRVLIIGTQDTAHITANGLDMNVQIIDEKEMYIHISPMEESIDPIIEVKTFSKLQKKQDDRFRAKHFRKL